MDERSYEWRGVRLQPHVAKRDGCLSALVIAQSHAALGHGRISTLRAARLEKQGLGRDSAIERRAVEGARDKSLT